MYETRTGRRNSSIFFFPSKLFFIEVHMSAVRRCEFMWSENGRSGGEVVLCVGISYELFCGYCATCISCKVFVPALPRDLADLKARIIAAVKNIDAPILTRVWQELEYRIDVCRVTGGAHIEHL